MTPAGMVLAFLSTSCGGGATPADNTPPVTVTITPARDTLTVGTQRTFEASVEGVPGDEVDWTVQEGDAAGTVSDAGIYTAAATGTFHLIAASRAEPAYSDTATVLVVAAPVANIVAPESAVPGTTGLLASVTAQPGAIYAWFIEGGTITGPATLPQVTFDAGDPGFLTLHCTVTNLAGKSASGSREVTIVAEH